MYKPKFESREYDILESTQEYIHFFNTQDSNLYEIRMNNQEETKSKKGDLSLWNHTTGKRVSGLYKKSSKNQVFGFDYLGDVFYLEINSETITIQYLYKKEGFVPYKKSIKKQPNITRRSAKPSKSNHDLLRVGLW